MQNKRNNRAECYEVRAKVIKLKTKTLHNMCTIHINIIFSKENIESSVTTYDINIFQRLQIVNKFDVSREMMWGDIKPCGMHIKTKWCTIRAIGPIEIANHKIDKCINLSGSDKNKRESVREREK